MDATRQRKGDVYREIKAGAVFPAERGAKRSKLASGVYVDTPDPDSMRYVAYIIIPEIFEC